MTTETVLTDAEIEACRIAGGGIVEEFARAIERAVLQSPEVQKMRRDADFWRFLIDNYAEYGTVGFIDGAALKVAIDAAMEKKE